MNERDKIIETITRLFWHVDQRQWDDLADLFADQIHLDYTSLTGGEPSVSAPNDVIDGWKVGLGGLDATQHLVSNHLIDVDGDTAEVTAQFVATHLLANPHGDPLWTLGGHYHLQLQRHADRWLIAAIKMTDTWASGNQQIMTHAAAG